MAGTYVRTETTIAADRFEGSIDRPPKVAPDFLFAGRKVKSMEIRDRRGIAVCAYGPRILRITFPDIAFRSIPPTRFLFLPTDRE